MSNASTTTVAGYLLTRLAEAGVVSVFGVPGDYNLGLLDAVTDRPGMTWIGMASEQGAGYAADSYARQRGSGRVRRVRPGGPHRRHAGAVGAPQWSAAAPQHAWR